MDKKKKKKVGLGIIAGITSASVLLSGTFDDPKQIIEDYEKKPIVPSEKVNDYYEEFLEFEDENSFKYKLQRLIYKVPVKIRAILCIPMWFLGTLLLSLLKLTFTPILNTILGFVIQTILLFLIIGICVKLLFPNLPWSKIFNKKTILITLIGSIIMSIVDFIMPMIWENYKLYRNISKLILGLIILVIVMRPFVKKKLKNRYSYDIKYDNKTLKLNN